MTPRLSARLESHLAVMAVASAAAITPSTDAQIIYSGLVNINIPVTAGGVYLNVANGTWSSSATSTPGWDVNPWGAASLDMFSPTAIPSGAYVGSGSTYTNLPSLTLISVSSTFATGSNSTPDATLNFNVQTNLIGFRFYNEALASYHYGWMRLSFAGSLSTSPRTIVEYAWEFGGGIITPFIGGDEPRGIRAGEIPAPATLPLFAIPILARRQRR